MITRRFDFDYKPLQPSQSITAESSVPDRQTFDAATGEYTPDYTLTPLVIRANISVLDTDGIIPSGDVNKDLANIRWYVTENGVEKLIQNTDTDYNIGEEGSSQAGEIQVMRNVDPASPVTLRFVAEYVDPRTGQLFTFNLTKLIRSYTEAATPRLELDSPAQVLYNPIRHASLQTVNAMFTLGGSPVPDANREFVWEILRSDGTWSEVDPETDYDVEVAADGDSVTVNREVMGDSLTIRCVAKYDADGSPSTQPVTAASPMKTVNFKRRVPEFWAEMLDVPYNIPVTPFIFPRCEVRDNIGILTDDQVNENFTVDWLMATNKPGGATLTYQKLASGISAQIPTTLMSQTIGGVLALDVNPCESWSAWADSDGKLLTDADGSILLIR